MSGLEVFIDLSVSPDILLHTGVSMVGQAHNMPHYLLTPTELHMYTTSPYAKE